MSALPTPLDMRHWKTTALPPPDEGEGFLVALTVLQIKLAEVVPVVVLFKDWPVLCGDVTTASAKFK